MSDENTELLQAFSQEVGAIRDQLKPIATTMRSSYQDASLFEKFGQTIDRIYGTAATLGFKPLADYCLAMKGINYKCSQSSNMYARGQVKDLNMVAMTMLDKFISIIMNPAEVKKIQYTMQKEQQRAEELSKKLFNTITRKTAA